MMSSEACGIGNSILFAFYTRSFRRHVFENVFRFGEDCLRHILLLFGREDTKEGRIEQELALVHFYTK